MATSTDDRIHVIPLESDPLIFTDLIGALGLHSLQFNDILSLDVADLLPGGALALPQPVYALIFLFPTSHTYEQDLKAAKSLAHSNGTQYTGRGAGEPVIWFDQTLRSSFFVAVYLSLRSLPVAYTMRVDYTQFYTLFRISDQLQRRT